jgi:hypothetical protein
VQQSNKSRTKWDWQPWLEFAGDMKSAESKAQSSAAWIAIGDHNRSACTGMGAKQHHLCQFPFFMGGLSTCSWKLELVNFRRKGRNNDPEKSARGEMMAGFVASLC